MNYDLPDWVSNLNPFHHTKNDQLDLKVTGEIKRMSDFHCTTGQMYTFIRSNVNNCCHCSSPAQHGSIDF